MGKTIGIAQGFWFIVKALLFLRTVRPVTSCVDDNLWISAILVRSFRNWICSLGHWKHLFWQFHEPEPFHRQRADSVQKELFFSSRKYFLIESWDEIKQATSASFWALPFSLRRLVKRWFFPENALYLHHIFYFFQPLKFPELLPEKLHL